jgi:(p)ppGpp synthase/HD superfamily hydrolase
MEEGLMASEPEGPATLLAAESQLLEATRLAWRWHGRQTRKGKASPYMSHLLQVQGLVINAGGNAEQAIAALLHDSLEDAPNPEERADRETLISSSFGPAVLQIVLDCTDTTTVEAGSNKGPWRVRKERYLAQLRGAEPASLLVAACDKHHNLGDLVSDLRHEGPETLSRFNAGATEQIWYFDALARICNPSIPTQLARELHDLVSELRRLTDPTDDGRHNT